MSAEDRAIFFANTARMAEIRRELREIKRREKDQAALAKRRERAIQREISDPDDESGGHLTIVLNIVP